MWRQRSITKQALLVKRALLLIFNEFYVMYQKVSTDVLTDIISMYLCIDTMLVIIRNFVILACAALINA
jgi:hypothetical protein